MSTTYSFYLGYKDANVFHAYGPFSKGEKGIFSQAPIQERTSSYMCQELIDDFHCENNKDMIGEELRPTFRSCNVFDDSDEKKYLLRYISYNELARMQGDCGIKHGYVDRKTVDAFEISKQHLFCDYDFEQISSFLYSTLDKEEQKNYVYYSWIDYDSKEFLIDQIVANVNLFNYSNMERGYLSDDEIYIFMSCQ